MPDRIIPRFRRKTRRGLSLTEVVVSVGLVSFGLATFAAFVPGVGRAMGRARHRDLATEACQKQLEYYRANGYAALPINARVSFAPAASLPRATGSAAFTPVDAAFQPTVGDSGRVRVEVAVTWDAGGGDRGAVRLTSLILR